MEGIKINDNLTITDETTALEIAEAFDVFVDVQLVRAIRIYGKMKAKSVRDQAIEIVLNADLNDDKKEIGIINAIQNIQE